MSVQENEITKTTPAAKVLKPAQVAAMLGVSKETVYNYIKDGLFTKEEYIEIRRGQRSRYSFFPTAVETFLLRHSGQIPPNLPAEKKKRQYNRRQEKGQRKKEN